MNHSVLRKKGSFMSMPDFAEANAFVAVLESRSFTKAARLIGLRLLG